MNTRFSIIIPVYNVVPYLRECLDSVLAQTFPDWEAICVDDGSTDGSGAILDEYAAKDGRFRVIHQKNAGVSAARNAALDVANGDYLVYVDADDLIGCKYLERINRAVDINDTPDVIRLNGYQRLANDGTVSYGRLKPILVSSALEQMCSSIIDNASLCLNVYKRNTFVSLRFPLGVRYGEDDVYMIHMLADVKSFAQVDVNEYFYRYQRIGAASRVLTCYDMAKLFNFLREEILLLKKKGCCCSAISAFYDAYIRKNLLRVLSRESREGASEMRRALLCCGKTLGLPLDNLTRGDRIGVEGFLRTGSWMIYDLICLSRRLLRRRISR